MKTMNALLLSILSNLLLLSAVSGFSSGSGSCIGGAAAVGGPHLSTDNGRNVTSGKLSDFGITLLLGGVALDPSNTQTILERNASYTVELTAPADTMRGCFIRFQGTIPKEDNLIVDSDGATTDISSLCDDSATAVGLTHVSSDFKEVCGGELILIDSDGSTDVNEVLTIEVTAVMANQEVSIYAYDIFQTNVIQSITTDPTDVATPDPSGSLIATLPPSDSTTVTVTDPDIPTEDPTSSPPTIDEGTDVPSDVSSDVGSDLSSDLTSSPGSVSTPVPSMASAPTSEAPAPTIDRGVEPTEAPINSAAIAVDHCRSLVGSLFIFLLGAILI